MVRCWGASCENADRVRRGIRLPSGGAGERLSKPLAACGGGRKKTREPRQRAQNAIMRRDEVQRETGLCRSTIYKRMKEGTFPALLKIGRGSSGWRVADVEAF
ncbi:helix-turn-helix transcriptional regulator [Trinickia soli]